MNAAPPAADPRLLHLVVGGHVDHGKSTLIGRLLADTGSLPEGKLEQVRANCARNSKPFEYAFLLDALKDEQTQGITIDMARVFFRTPRRPYILIDAPGHIEFLRNLITGAARAEAALLVIDAKEGVRENSRRHGYMMSMLGIRQLVVVVNKMDLVGYDQGVFSRIESEYREFLGRLGVQPGGFVPVSGREGENIARPSAAMPWYTGPTVLETIDRFRADPPDAEKPFRMPVQDVYKFTQQGDERRIVAGSVDSGRVSVGDEVVFYPSGKKSKVASVEAFHRPPLTSACAGEAAGFTLTEQIYVGRGELATVAGQLRPQVTTRIRASVFWLGRQPMVKQKDYMLKLGTARVPVRLEEIHRVLDASTLVADEKKPRIDRHEVAEVTLRTSRAMAFDLAADLAGTSRFVLVDDFEIRGGGIVREALPDRLSTVRDQVLLRNFKWEPSRISAEQRAEGYHQRPTLVLLTGTKAPGRKRLAKDVEQALFALGNVVYFLGIGNVLYGVDADLTRGDENRTEHLRRLAEVANLMLDAGVILFVTAADLTQEDLALIRTTVDADRILVLWVGADKTTDIPHDLVIPDPDAPDAVAQIKQLLQDRGIIYRPW
ncbi:MAG: adenylyl-sulfate kinase [Candidatus Brocadiae bacterium]|nr:adenylyl-sulfate kinase [Candidatus Brocadiia bacterium]